MRTVGPALRRALLLLALLAALAVFAAAADTPEEFYAEVEANLRAQNTEFSVPYTDNRDLLGLPRLAPLGICMREMSAHSPDGPDNADYAALNLENGTMIWKDGAYHFNISYLSTAEELAYVENAVEEIVEELDLDGLDDYTKIKLIYEYVCTSFVYDDTLTKYTDYEGLTTGSMVCQGYALLTSRLLWEAGVPSRIVTGTSFNENHAWNIVKLDGEWYYLDATWDGAATVDGVVTWDYFLKGEEDFRQHDAFPSYLSGAFYESHPLADEGVPLRRVYLAIDTGVVENLIIRTGVPVRMTAVWEDGTPVDVRWISTNPTDIEISEDGTLLANRLSSTVVTAEVIGDRGAVSSQVPVSSVDLRGASDWAEETVTEYYLAQLLPVGQCSDFQQGITRGQLAELVSQYVRHLHGWPSISGISPMEDVLQSPYGGYIARCLNVGIMEGVSETSFDPDGIVTREQAAKVLVRLMEYVDGATYADPAAAIPAGAEGASDWAKPYLAAAVEQGVLQGFGGSLHPRDEMTREQIIVAFHRIYEARWLTEEAA